MNKILSTIYGGFRNIKLIAQDAHHLPNIDCSTLIGSASYMPHLLGVNKSADLLIIDLDAFGFEKTRCLVFMACCFIPGTPLVIQAGSVIADSQRNELLRSGNVLDVIESHHRASVA